MTRPLPHPLRRSLVRIALAATLVGAVAGTLLTAPGSASAAGPAYHVPKVGTCHDLTLRQLGGSSDTSASVSCDARHTTRTIAVGRPTSGVDLTDPVIVSRLGATYCVPALSEALGSTRSARAQSAYLSAFFVPTRAEQARGASWVRCDLFLIGGTKTLPLRSDARPLLPTGDLPDKIARCLAPRSLVLTACSQPHTYRATGTYSLTGRYPSFEDRERIARRRCPSRTTSTIYTWTTASEFGYRAGQREMTCYTRTRR